MHPTCARGQPLLGHSQGCSTAAWTAPASSSRRRARCLSPSVPLHCSPASPAPQSRLALQGQSTSHRSLPQLIPSACAWLPRVQQPCTPVPPAQCAQAVTTGSWRFCPQLQNTAAASHQLQSSQRCLAPAPRSRPAGMFHCHSHRCSPLLSSHCLQLWPAVAALPPLPSSQHCLAPGPCSKRASMLHRHGHRCSLLLSMACLHTHMRSQVLSVLRSHSHKRSPPLISQWAVPVLWPPPLGASTLWRWEACTLHSLLLASLLLAVPSAACARCLPRSSAGGWRCAQQ